MKKILLPFGCLIIIAAMAGCVRTYTTVMDRVDVEVAGNQGVIYGPKPEAYTVENSTREILNVDIELPMPREVKAALKPKPSGQQSTPDRDVTGNAGVVSGTE